MTSIKEIPIRIPLRHDGRGELTVNDEVLSPIPEAMRALTEEISVLEKCINELQKKVFPVCKPIERPEECEAENEKIQSLLGLGIENQTYRIITLRKQIQDLLNVIEL